MSNTPGPWTFQKQPYVRGFSDAWNVWEDATDTHDGHVVAHCLDEANAKLIASAPEMLEVLRDVVCARLEHLTPEAYYDAMDSICRLAHHVIANAEG